MRAFGRYYRFNSIFFSVFYIKIIRIKNLKFSAIVQNIAVNKKVERKFFIFYFKPGSGVKLTRKILYPRLVPTYILCNLSD